MRLCLTTGLWVIYIKITTQWVVLPSDIDVLDVMTV